jgi:hypothetical protein
LRGPCRNRRQAIAAYPKSESSQAIRARSNRKIARGSSHVVMAGLVPAIPIRAVCHPDRDRRDKPGDDARGFALYRQHRAGSSISRPAGNFGSIYYRADKRSASAAPFPRPFLP